MNADQSAFLKTVVPAAQYAQKSYGVPASITIAQAILESGWGKSALATTCNNYFGIKAMDYMAPELYEEFPSAEYVNGKEVLITSKFMKYASLQLSFGAHARLLALSPRYQPAMIVKTDPARFAVRLQDCGYSTNSRYSASLMALVKEFDLTQYDVQPPPEQAAQAKDKTDNPETQKEKAA